jgi:hypothetical protein
MVGLARVRRRNEAEIDTVSCRRQAAHGQKLSLKKCTRIEHNTNRSVGD